MASKKRITAGEIKLAMAKRWCAPEWAVMWEVANGTGATVRRYADAVMMSLWPSRGLELHGVEIKVTRSDWKREAADPTKAETIAKFCDRWWVHTPPGVIDDISDVPPAWGLREWNGKQWRTVREAEKTQAEPINRIFLAAMLRRADETMRQLVRDGAQAGQDKVEEERARLNEQFKSRVENAVKMRTQALQSASDKIAAFEAAFGEDFFKGWYGDHQRLGQAARILVDAHTQWGNFTDLEKRFRRAADELAEINKLFVHEAA